MRHIISDTHFGHENVIEYCDRPFDDVTEMDLRMVQAWCHNVRTDDPIIHLGDVRHHPDALDEATWLSRLPGRPLLVRGNHDSPGPNFPFQVVESCVISHGRYCFYLEHAPVNNPEIWQIHGHIHNNEPISYPFIHYERKNINVSVEQIDYAPISMDELVFYLEAGETYSTIHEARADNPYPDET